MKKLILAVLLFCTPLLIAQETQDKAVDKAAVPDKTQEKAQENATAANKTVEKPADAVVDKAIPKNAKVFVTPMNGFETYLVEALKTKNVPVEVVADPSLADFEITGAAESKKAGVAKILLTGSWHSKESASVTVSNLKTGVAVWAYAYHTYDSVHGKRSSAEACAKHLKQKIESGK